MLECKDCGNIFPEEELAEWKEERGEFWGQPCYEMCSGCPCCHSSDVHEVEEKED